MTAMCNATFERVQKRQIKSVVSVKMYKRRSMKIRTEHYRVFQKNGPPDLFWW